jgi:hypothetical protein
VPGFTFEEIILRRTKLIRNTNFTNCISLALAELAPQQALRGRPEL